MEEKINAICIRSASYKDNDKMLTLFSLENGLVDCMARGVKKQGAKLRFSAEPFCFAEYVLVEKSGRRTVVEANEIDSFYDIRMDVDKFYSASAIIEFLRKFLVEGERYYDLFLLTVQALKNIESGKVDPVSALVKFFMSAMDLLGYGLTFSYCEKCKKEIEGRVFFDFDDNAFTCGNCSKLSSVEMRASTFNFLSILYSLSFEDLKNGGLSAYSPTFQDKTPQIYALKFFDFYIKDKTGVTMKAVASILEMNG